jgi:hypothetical protein
MSVGGAAVPDAAEHGAPVRHGVNAEQHCHVPGGPATDAERCASVWAGRRSAAGGSTDAEHQLPGLSGVHAVLHPGAGDVPAHATLYVRSFQAVLTHERKWRRRAAAIVTKARGAASAAAPEFVRLGDERAQSWRMESKFHAESVGFSPTRIVVSLTK